jgi:hypothetical protein
MEECVEAVKDITDINDTDAKKFDTIIQEHMAAVRGQVRHDEETRMLDYDDMVARATVTSSKSSSSTSSLDTTGTSGSPVIEQEDSAAAVPEIVKSEPTPSESKSESKGSESEDSNFPSPVNSETKSTSEDLPPTPLATSSQSSADPDDAPPQPPDVVAEDYSFANVLPVKLFVHKDSALDAPTKQIKRRMMDMAVKWHLAHTWSGIPHNSPRDFTLSEAQEITRKEVNGFRWIFGTEHITEETDTLHAFADAYTHCTTGNIYSTLCEDILKDPYLREATMMENETFALRFTTIKYVDITAAKHKHYLFYARDTLTYENTLTHVANQLLLRGLCARARKPNPSSRMKFEDGVEARMNTKIEGYTDYKNSTERPRTNARSVKRDPSAPSKLGEWRNRMRKAFTGVDDQAEPALAATRAAAFRGIDGSGSSIPTTVRSPHEPEHDPTNWGPTQPVYVEPCFRPGEHSPTSSQNVPLTKSESVTPRTSKTQIIATITGLTLFAGGVSLLTAGLNSRVPRT